MRDLLTVMLALGVLGAVVVKCPAQSISEIEQEMIGLVDGMSGSIVSVAAVSGPSRVASGKSIGGLAARAKSVGCGIVFDKSGLILTTASVVGYAPGVEVRTPDGKQFKGTVVGLDPTSDIAVIKVDTADLKPARFARDTSLVPGSLILVLGNAFGSLPSVAMGMVSSLTPAESGGADERMLRLSVPINPGDTGGPVVNTRGEVIGIVIGRLSFESQTQAVRIGDRAVFGFTSALQPSNMSVALPAQRALKIAREIMAEGTAKRGFLGVSVLDISPEMRSESGDVDLEGVLVVDVLPGSPAESIGLVPGDVITQFGRAKVASVTQLHDVVKGTAPGEVVSINYSRQGNAVADGVRIGWYTPEYVRQVSFVRPRLKAEDIKIYIEDLKAQIDMLNAQLKEIEERH